MNRRGLGRGLSSLIPTTQEQEHVERTSAEAAASAGLRLIAIGDVSPNPRQPRQAIPPEALAELAASIKEHGVIQPIIVTAGQLTDPTPYLIIAGERRWRAARLAGLLEVPVVVKEASQRDMLELALVENIQRSDLNPLEEAAAYQAMMEEFGLTQEQVADRVGKSRTAVANIVRLLRLPQPVKNALIEGQIHEGHARALLGLNSDAAMNETAQLVVNRGLSVRQTEELVRRLNAPAPEPVADDAPIGMLDTSPESRAIEDRLRDHLGTKVNLFRTRKGGRIVIHFFSEEELADLYDKLIAEPL